MSKKQFSNQGSNAQLGSIQILRALAASLVVLHHFSLDYAFRYPGNSLIGRSGFGMLGASGVDIFFVISGFIMIYTGRNKSGFADAGEFLKRRVLRIFPLYWIATLAYLIVTRSAHSASIGFVVASFLLLPYSDGHSFHPLLTQGWTLSFEMLFYIAFACTLATVTRSIRLAGIAGFLIVGAVIGWFLPSGSGAHHLLDSSLTIEFLFGALIGTAYLKWKDRTPRILPALCILISLAGFAISINLHLDERWRFLYWGMPSFLLVLGAVLSKARTFPVVLIFLGDASYSIYLTHGFLRPAFGHLLLHPELVSKVPGDLLLMVIALISIFTTSLVYRFIEAPLNARLFHRSKIKSLPTLTSVQ